MKRRRRSDRRSKGIRQIWRALNIEQRVAAIGAVLLIVSTFGPFSFVEAAVALTGLAVLALLRARGEGRRFHLPLGDGTAILMAALWSALLIVTRLLDRPLGQSVLALGCAVILAAAGLRERTKRPPDDLPPEAPPRPGGEPAPAPTEPLHPDPDEEPTAWLDHGIGEDPTQRLAGEPHDDPAARGDEERTTQRVNESEGEPSGRLWDEPADKTTQRLRRLITSAPQPARPPGPSARRRPRAVHPRALHPHTRRPPPGSADR